MAKTRIDKVKRKAAGHTCLLLFHSTCGIAHGLHTVAAHRESGLGAGLSERERAYVENLATEMSKQANTVRKLGWRFLNKDAK
jgi:hypothetical protein